MAATQSLKDVAHLLTPTLIQDATHFVDAQFSQATLRHFETTMPPTSPLHICRTGIGSGRRAQKKACRKQVVKKVQVTQKVLESLKDPHTCDPNLDFHWLNMY